jgi:hypothetical protein
MGTHIDKTCLRTAHDVGPSPGVPPSRVRDTVFLPLHCRSESGRVRLPGETTGLTRDLVRGRWGKRRTNFRQVPRD